jgi:prolyl-tRNA editing enzyme YbaK/EbsC (Cys-tRNA(Pro) deacylase)
MFDFEKVKSHLNEKSIPFEVVEFPDEVISARLEDNSLTKNYDPKNSIKTLVVETKTGFAGIVMRGMDRLDSKKAKEILGRWSIVNSEVLENDLGFKVGGINPFCLDIPLYVDEKVKLLEILSMGAGSQSKGVNVKTDVLLGLANVEIKSLAQD